MIFISNFELCIKLRGTSSYKGYYNELFNLTVIIFIFSGYQTGYRIENKSFEFDVFIDNEGFLSCVPVVFLHSFLHEPGTGKDKFKEKMPNFPKFECNII